MPLQPTSREIPSTGTPAFDHLIRSAGVLPVRAVDAAVQTHRMCLPGPANFAGTSSVSLPVSVATVRDRFGTTETLGCCVQRQPPNDQERALTDLESELGSRVDLPVSVLISFAFMHHRPRPDPDAGF